MSTSVSDLQEFIRSEQGRLWHDLDDSLRRAINAAWSIEAADIAARIVRAARLVGLTPWKSVPVGLVFGGVYETLANIARLEVSLPTEQEERELFERRVLRGLTSLEPEKFRARYSHTLDAMLRPREQSYICTGEE